MNEQASGRIRILLICCLSLFIVGLDITAVNVALPSIGRDLDAGISGLQWTVDAYTLVLASLLMLGGSTGDRLGRRRVFVVGLTVFSVASLLCSLAPSVGLLVAFTFGIIEAPIRGWSSPAIVAVFAASAAALLGLLRYEPRREEPLVDLRFFRSIPFASSIAICVAAFSAFGGFLFLNTLYLQQERGLSPMQAGLATVPVAVMTVVASPLSGRIVGRRGPRVPLAIAGVALVTGCTMLVGIDRATSLWWLIAAYVVLGLGFGLVNAPITNAAVSGMPRAQAGVAAAIATTSRQVGQTLGVAVVGAIVASGSHASAWWTLTACGAVVLLLAFVATAARARESARRTAAALNPEALAA